MRRKVHFFSWEGIASTHFFSVFPFERTRVGRAFFPLGAVSGLLEHLHPVFPKFPQGIVQFGVVFAGVIKYVNGNFPVNHARGAGLVGVVLLVTFNDVK